MAKKHLKPDSKRAPMDVGLAQGWSAPNDPQHYSYNLMPNGFGWSTGSTQRVKVLWGTLLETQTTSCYRGAWASYAVNPYQLDNTGGFVHMMKDKYLGVAEALIDIWVWGGGNDVNLSTGCQVLQPDPMPGTYNIGPLPSGDVGANWSIGASTPDNQLIQSGDGMYIADTANVNPAFSMMGQRGAAPTRQFVLTGSAVGQWQGKGCVYSGVAIDVVNQSGGDFIITFNGDGTLTGRYSPSGMPAITFTASLDPMRKSKK